MKYDSKKNHIIRNLATSLVLYEQIDTTETKAKVVKSFLDKILASAKKGGLTTIRELNGIFFDRNATKKIMAELTPRYEGRNSGFIKSYHLKNRLGDNAKMMRLELVDRKVFVDPAKEETKKVVKEDKKVKDSDVKVETKVRTRKNAN
jgi:large subunit ribosomal protein L17